MPALRLAPESLNQSHLLKILQHRIDCRILEPEGTIAQRPYRLYDLISIRRSLDIPDGSEDKHGIKA